MTILFSTLNQMAFLLILIVIGFVLTRFNIVQAEGANILSKLENNVFIPALVIGTFMQNFTIDKIASAGNFILCGLIVITISCPIAVVLAKLCSKDNHTQKIYTYGLAFSNFGFMGNAVVSALFPNIFMEYLIFGLPFWVYIYVWGVPYLLIPSTTEKKSLKSVLKNLINPMFISMIIGIILGLTKLSIPSFLNTSITTLGNCMSPMAMILTGMTIAKIDLKAIIKNISIYAVSIIRLILIPVAFIGILKFIPISYELALCTVCSVAMPLGLNTIVIPSAYGKDTSVAAGMALISHVLSCLTIPLIFFLFDIVIK